ncbi:MAG: Gfo/Idh/MocA family oxidoreductase [Opitutaceae bacterium]|nr:Gfo/Idh/MocA family oxidoreductase [Opitutaceae bacterium]
MSSDRRSFVKTLSAAGLAALGSSLAHAEPVPNKSGKRLRYAIVGTGHRHRMYRSAILGDYKEHAELVGLCDINPGRAALSAKVAADAGVKVPTYVAADFDTMVKETKPDVVIVTTVDATHDDYIVRSLDLGCDVITEKPMTTTAEKCQRILDAKKRSGKTVRVTFNYRYSPPRTQVKDILMSGEIGDILSVDFHWLLNTTHGADYFRRWHANKKNSGGLMIHKATHHFDLVNWWLSAQPASVVAVGKREFYTPAMAKRFGLSGPHERCRTCPEKDKCGFFMDLAAEPSLKALYLDNEHHDGYFRDRCVFRDSIDIEDTMNVIVKYDTGTTLSYSLNAFNAWEGYQIAFNGTKGRLEHSIVEQIYTAGTNQVQGGIAEGGVKTRVIPLRGPAKDYQPWTGTGGHGGGDKALLDDIFVINPPADKYQRNSDERGGAASILIGVAANQCFETGQPVQLASLVQGWDRPALTPMPTHLDPVPMPVRRPRGG